MKKILFWGFLILVIPPAVLGGYMTVKSYVLDVPFASQAADTLRSLFGIDFVMWLEEQMYEASDTWKMFQQEDVAVNPQQQAFIECLEQSHVSQVDCQQLLSQDKNENPPPHRPADIVPLLNEPVLESEGIWIPVVEGSDILFRTVIRPDVRRSYTVVDLLSIDVSRVDIGLAWGTIFLDQHERVGDGKIPEHLKPRMIACFNGGFSPLHDQGGVIIGNEEKWPLKEGRATFVYLDNGFAQVVEYHPSLKEQWQQQGLNILIARQNQPPILHHGVINDQVTRWGVVAKENKPLDVDWTLPPDRNTIEEKGIDAVKQLDKKLGQPILGICAWRSGLGITDNGLLIYAAGSSVTAQTLAYALKLAGCHTAMHLDMNFTHVICNYYLRKQKGDFVPYSLSKRLNQKQVGRYLHPYTHDFFIIAVKEDKELEPYLLHD